MNDKELKTLKAILELGQNYTCCCGCGSTISSILTINRIHGEPKYLVMSAKANLTVSNPGEHLSSVLYGIDSKKMLIINYSYYPEMEEINSAIRKMKDLISTGYHTHE